MQKNLCQLVCGAQHNMHILKMFYNIIVMVVFPCSLGPLYSYPRWHKYSSSVLYSSFATQTVATLLIVS